MEIFLRLLLLSAKVFAFVLSPLIRFLDSKRSGAARLALCVPPITDRRLTLSLKEARAQLKSRKLTSVELVNAYIARLKTVNRQLNAIVENRFEAALREAAAADKLIEQRCNDLDKLFAKYPLHGLPVTVKETCSLANMIFALGSLPRKGMRAERDGVAVALVRAAGAIPLLVSATPEYCFGMDTSTLLNGCCVNPYDFERIPGGSSGGEGALNGAGASLFGIGSDIGGSIRLPSLFCGIFGHKPTGGVVSVVGHMPEGSDEDFSKYLQVGPLSRFACDLPELLEIMAGDKASKLQLREPVQLQQLKVFYSYGFEGLNGLLHQRVGADIQACIGIAVQHLQSLGLTAQKAKLAGFHNSLEIALSGIVRQSTMSYLLPGSSCGQTLLQIARSVLGLSKYTTGGLFFELMRRANAYMPKAHLPQYKEQAETLLQEFTQLLGNNGVMLIPTMHTPAPRHKWTPLALWGIDYTLIFNVLKMPATHVPMGRNKNGLPIGLSVVAAPYQDRLCLRVAEELERAFGGWIPATPHKFNN